MPRILVVDDNSSAADALARVLAKRGVETEVSYDGASAIERLGSFRPDLVLTDLKMEPVDGMQVLAAARAATPPVDVIVFTAFGEVDLAVRAMQLGARDFLTKPITAEQVLSRIAAVTGGDAGPRRSAAPVVANAPTTQALVAQLERLGSVNTPVWIEGEIGSGRTYAAELLHRYGDASRPFVVRDPSRDHTMPTEGTVVLTSVDDLNDAQQRQLIAQLRSLEPGVRVIATSRLDARAAVTQGTLRSDLYYALAVITVSVPPLRERAADVVPLFRQALTHFSQQYKLPIPELSAALTERLVLHAWPGNVRELFNLAERAVVLGADGLQITPLRRTSADLPALEPGFNLADYLEDIERRILLAALAQADGDRNIAGQLLGVERNTLRYKLNKYNLL